MSETKPQGTSISRRHFITGVAASAAGLTLAARNGRTQEMPMLAEDDPNAVALKYVADAADADASLRQDGASCSSCALYNGRCRLRVRALQHFPRQAGIRRRLVQRLGAAA